MYSISEIFVPTIENGRKTLCVRLRSSIRSHAMALIVCGDQLSIDLYFRPTTSRPSSAAIVVPRESSRRKKTDLSRKKRAVLYEITNLECGEIRKMDCPLQEC